MKANPPHAVVRVTDQASPEVRRLPREGTKTLTCQVWWSPQQKNLFSNLSSGKLIALTAPFVIEKNVLIGYVAGADGEIA